MKLAPALEKLRSLEPALRSQGVCGLHVFGSQARADAGPGSDLDLMFDIDPGARLSLFDQARITRQLSEFLAIQVDLVPSRSLHPLVKAKADAERLTIFG